MGIIIFYSVMKHKDKISYLNIFFKADIFPSVIFIHSLNFTCHNAAIVLTVCVIFNGIKLLSRRGSRQTLVILLNRENGSLMRKLCSNKELSVPLPSWARRSIYHQGLLGTSMFQGISGAQECPINRSDVSHHPFITGRPLIMIFI